MHQLPILSEADVADDEERIWAEVSADLAEKRWCRRIDSLEYDFDPSDDPHSPYHA